MHTEYLKLQARSQGVGGDPDCPKCVASFKRHFEILYMCMMTSWLVPFIDALISTISTTILFAE